MRTSEQSPNGVNGFSTLLVDSEQFTPWCSSSCAASTPRIDAVALAAAHQEQVGRRQHGDRHAGVGRVARASGSKRSGGNSDILVTWPIVTRPP